MTSMNRAIEIIDTDLDHMLVRPGMYIGGDAPVFHRCFWLMIVHLLSVRSRILEIDVSWREISHNLLVDMTGSGSGSLGPNSRLSDFYGENSFVPGDPNHGNVMLFWREFVTRMRSAMEPPACEHVWQRSGYQGIVRTCRKCGEEYAEL